MADDDMVVEIAGADAPAEGGAATEAAVGEVAERFKALEADVARERDARAAEQRARAAAEAAAQQAARERDTVVKELTDTRVSTVEDGIAAATREIEAAKKEIKSAGEAGDHGAQADAYDKLAAARARIERLNEAKADLDIARIEPVRGRVEAPAREAPTITRVDDPVETAVAGMSARSADWLRRHPDYVTDGKKNAKIRAAHFDAVGEGLDIDTDDYFAHIETYVGLRSDAAATGNGHAVVVNAGNGGAKPAGKPAARRAPVAPVQASGGSTGNGDRAVVRLTQKQAEAAVDGTHVWNYDDPSPQKRFKKGDPIGHNEMARRVHEMTKQGLFRPENSELS